MQTESIGPCTRCGHKQKTTAHNATKPPQRTHNDKRRNNPTTKQNRTPNTRTHKRNKTPISPPSKNPHHPRQNHNHPTHRPSRNPTIAPNTMDKPSLIDLTDLPYLPYPTQTQYTQEQINTILQHTQTIINHSKKSRFHKAKKIHQTANNIKTILQNPTK